MALHVAGSRSNAEARRVVMVSEVDARRIRAENSHRWKRSCTPPTSLRVHWQSGRQKKQARQKGEGQSLALTIRRFLMSCHHILANSSCSWLGSREGLLFTPPVRRAGSQRCFRFEAPMTLPISRSAMAR